MNGVDTVRMRTHVPIRGPKELYEIAGVQKSGLKVEASGVTAVGYVRTFERFGLVGDVGECVEKLALLTRGRY